MSVGARATLRQVWIGAIRLAVDGPARGAVKVTLLRDGSPLLRLLCEAPGPSAFSLPRVNDLTPQLPDGGAQLPLPYPPHGIEFTHGLRGHLALELTAGGEPAELGTIELAVRELRLGGHRFQALQWDEDADWTPLGLWRLDPEEAADTASGLLSWALELR